MGEYLTPGVYTENKKNGYSPIESVSTSTGAYVGIALRGKVGKPTIVTSWSDYIKKYAGGLESPFIINSDLAYAVNGFFKNGGKRCYINRVDNGASESASLTINTTENEVTVGALDEGDWGNDVAATIIENTYTTGTFDVRITFNDEVEVYSALSNDPAEQTYFAKWINNRSSLVKFSDGKLVATAESKLTGGVTGNDNLTDADYLRALEEFDPIIDDINLLSVPGQTSTPMLKSILDYCSKTAEVFPILDMPPYSSVEELRTIRQQLTGVVGALYDPWIKVIDPISTTGDYRDVPPSGHIMGIYARTIAERGTHKAPAGVEADVRGIVDLTTIRSVGGQNSGGDTDFMNPVSINAIITKPNYGIVVWGARTLNTDTNFRYVSDVLFNIMIKKSIRNGTQWCCFEPNYIDAPMWTRAYNTVRAYLHTLWMNGQLAGASESEAFWIQIDGENNTQETIDNGFFYIDFAYAPTKPAEFIVNRIQHGIVSY